MFLIDTKQTKLRNTENTALYISKLSTKMDSTCIWQYISLPNIHRLCVY